MLTTPTKVQSNLIGLVSELISTTKF